MAKGIPTRPMAKRINKLPVVVLVSTLALIILFCFYTVTQKQKEAQTTSEAHAIEAPPINNDTTAPNYLHEAYAAELAEKQRRSILAEQEARDRAVQKDNLLAKDKNQDLRPQENKGLNNAANKPFQPYYEKQVEMQSKKSEAQLFQEKVASQRREMRLKAKMAPTSINVSSVHSASQQAAGAPNAGFVAPTANRQQIPSWLLPQQQEKPDQAQKQEFLSSSNEGQVSLANAYHQAISPFELKQGHLIPITLITKINSDLPGQIKAQVTENVYDSATGNYLLIPQGTTVNGIYDSRVVFGQKRALIAWQRLIFPDGSTLNVGSMPGADQEGAAGLSDLVDNHYFRIFGSAILMSVVNAGFTLATDTGTTPTDKETAQDALAKSAAQQMQQTFARMIDKMMNIQPELIIRQGKQGHILLTKDVIGLKPYDPASKPTYYLKTAAINSKG